MDHKIEVIEQHPLRFLISFNLMRPQPGLFQAQLYFVGNRLHLPRIAAAAHHKVVGKRTRSLLQFQYREFFCLFLQAGFYCFRDLYFRFVLLHAEISRRSSVFSRLPSHCSRPRRPGPGTGNFNYKYSPCFLMYSSTPASTNLRSGFLATTASRIAVAETGCCTPSSKRTVAPRNTKSPLAGCLAKGRLTARAGRRLSGNALATSASEYPGRLATMNSHSRSSPSGSRHLAMSAKASMPIRKNSLSIFFSDCF